MTHQPHPSRRSEAGSAAVELTLLTPVLIGLLLFLVAAGRAATSRSQLEAAARDAARAAANARTAPAAERAAIAAAQATIIEGGVACQRLTVSIEGSDLRPGGSAYAQLSCQVSYAGLTGIGLPGSRTISVQFRAPIDTFRAMP